jgi:hypothetical protein
MYDLKTYRSGTPIEKKLACMDIEILMSILHRSITKMESKTRDTEFEAWPKWFRDPSNWKYAEGKQVYPLETMDVDALYYLVRSMGASFYSAADALKKNRVDGKTFISDGFVVQGLVPSQNIRLNLEIEQLFPHDIRVIMQDVTSHLKMQEDARKQEAEKEVIQNQENTTHRHTKPLLKPLPPDIVTIKI